MWITVALLTIGRVGAFFVLLPQISSARVPMALRAYFAIAVSLSIMPVVSGDIEPRVRELTEPMLILAVAGEIATGLALGFLVRLFFLALNFSGVMIAQFLGFVGMGTQSIEDDEAGQALTDLIGLTVALLFIMADAHLLLIGALIGSFTNIPVLDNLSAAEAMERISEVASAAFMLALKFSAPFTLYAIVCNIIIGLANRLVPQVPVQFISAPAVVAGGLFLGYLVLGLSSQLFVDAIIAWLGRW